MITTKDGGDNEPEDKVNNDKQAQLDEENMYRKFNHKEGMAFEQYVSRDNHYLSKQKARLKSLAPPLGLYHPKEITKNVKVLPHYSTEIRLNPDMDRFTMVNKKKLDD